MGDSINVVLGLGMLNLEAYLAEEACARDMVTAREFEQLLAAKVKRFTGGQTAYDGFFGITNIEGIPEIAGSITNGEVSIPTAWEFRQSKSAQDFRAWFDEIGIDDPSEFQKHYLDVIKSGHVWSGTTAKTIRYCAVQAAGIGMIPILGPASVIASMAISAVDSLLLDKILERVRLGRSPRYFIDDVRHRLFS